MRKLLLVLLLFFLVPKTVDASLVTLDKDGAVRINVLSSASPALEIPRREYLKIKEVASVEFSSESKVSLSKNVNGEIMLNVVTGNRINELSVTDYKDDLIEIEERGETRKIKIKTDNGKFSIEERGIHAITDFPISVNPETAQLSVKTPSGDRYVAILPYQAIESLVRTGTINSLAKEQRLELFENDRGDLLYTVSGDKLFKIFNLIDYSVPVSAQVSVSTGEVVTLEQPLWLPLMNLLFG